MEWITVVLVLAVGYQVWGVRQRWRQRALLLLRRYVEERHIQLLDDTLVLQKMRWQAGQIVCCYGFEFTSTGAERYSGYLNIAGHKLISVDLDSYRLPTDEDHH